MLSSRPLSGRLGRWLALLLIAVLARVAVAAEPSLVERIPAVVAGRPVMLSEVRLLARVRGLAPDLALEALVDERLMFREASRLPQAAVGSEEEQRAYEQLAAPIPEDERAALAEDLHRLARRQLAILKYVDFRLRPQVRIAEPDVRAAYQARYGGEPAAPPYEQVSAEVQKALFDRALDERIEAWVKDLRSTAEIRYNP